MVGREQDVVSIGSADGVAPVMDFAEVPEVKAGKNRLHVDLRPDGRSTAEELHRLLSSVPPVSMWVRGRT